MKYFESSRSKKIDEYVFISQVFFFLLVGLLSVRAFGFVNMSWSSIYKQFLLLIMPVLLLVVLKVVENNWYAGCRQVLNSAVNLIYLVYVTFLLTYESETFFKFLLLMPVVVSALQYGARRGFIWAALASIGTIMIAFSRQPQLMDVDILVMGMIWLFAWMLGKMSETELEVRKELLRQAAVDGLTGVYNHRSFYSLLEEYYIKAKIANGNLSLIMVDINFFKYYNDAYGHQKGDEALKKLARLIEEGVNDQGICARYGGDEFAVILPDCDDKCAVEIGERIRQEVEKTEFEGANILPRGHFSISVGVASFPEHAATKEQLIQKADEALYKAKFTNSNRVEVYYSVFDEIGHSLQDKEKELLSSMRTLLMVVNAKDRYTYGHSERVMHYAVQIGRKMALWEWEIQDVSIGALLHDIGKIEISREILNKPGMLTAQEWEAIRQHPAWGADMIRPISSFSGAVDIVLYHHENYDGSGYPSSLKGTEIPLGARILRLADSFDAITSNRPYKRTLSIREAIEDINKYRGIYYDPEVIDAFLEFLYETGILAENVS